MKKLLSAAVALGVLTSTSLTPAVFADVAATALPSLNSATNADVTVGTNNNMNIQIQGGQGGLGTLNWNNYNVGKDASVNYEFTAHNQTALNKVNASGGLSQIYGKITSSACADCGYDAKVAYHFGTNAYDIEVQKNGMNGSMLLMGGGIGLAAIGSSVAFIVKSLRKISSTNLPPTGFVISR